ncbi:MAG: prepilin peptidase [Candidatus Moraniibacteriota bacterium]|nr:MAG: prepilin peptidase [Candidatus Moranbacteria bacterium]
MITFLFLFFLFGLIVGSFLHVVVVRFHSAETLLGRSYCRVCRRLIQWFDNIPLLSFLLLRGKCRRCKSLISWRYPLAELLTGCLFFLVGWKFFESTDMFSWGETFFYLLVVSFSLIIVLYDAKHYEIPMRILWGLLFSTIIFFFFVDFITFSQKTSFWDFRLYSGLFSGTIAFLFFFSLSFFSKERWMGYGDAYVAFTIGLLLGPDSLEAILLSFILGALYGVGQIILKRKTLSSQVPFAPFLFLGMFCSVFFGDVLAKFFPFVFFF